MKLGPIVLRTVLGAVFVGHGTQKLFGWFDGQGLHETADAFDEIGLRPGRPHATTAGISETVGGALIASGLLTPVGSALITGVMTQAIRSVHAGKGPWWTDGGWEYNVVLIAAVFAIAEQGPGEWSLDHARGKTRSGPVWASAALIAGVVAPAVLTRAIFLAAAATGVPM